MEPPSQKTQDFLTISRELSKYPLNGMPGLQERFKKGECFGAVYFVNWKSGMRGDVLVFDMGRKSCIKEEDHEKYSQMLCDEFMAKDYFECNGSHC